mgnify:CR=1 FL=1|tara:strand:- start:141 stop:668 length:528 start_codon:yes stop_codon:yes gene_type:complete
MFVKGEKYKRKHIHIKYGGGHQSGISNSSNKPFIFIFSGKSGKDHGYSDEWDEEGYFWYSGQGQKGDMAFVRGNKSILNHQIDDNKIFLFEGTNVSGYWAFVDEHCYNDSDGDDICGEYEIAGCTDLAAVNYNPFATDDDGSCIIQVGGCVIPFACNYDPDADYYLPGSCDFSCL